MKVDFFVAGVQKAGTTALDAMLRRHPQIQMARVKEPHVFDDEDIQWDAPSYDKLHGCYDWSAPGVLRGEATPIYTYWPEALRRIRWYNRNAKLIVGLRHPAYRAFSHWKMEVSRGAETLSFAEAIREGRARVTAAVNKVHRVYSYVERGYYAQQVGRLLLFDPSQVHYFRTDTLWRYPDRTLSGIYDFLGVEPFNLSQHEYIVAIESRDLGAPSEEDLRYLLDLFSADIGATSMLTRLDLRDWGSLDYREPMRPAGR